MKDFNSVIKEAFEFPLASPSHDGKHETFASKNLHNPDIRAQLNVVLLRVTDGLFNNPWTALNNAAKQLGFYGILLPKVHFPSVEGGEVVWKIDQFGEAHGYTPVAGSENDTTEEIFLFFEYQLTSNGRYLCFAEIVSSSQLDAYLNDSEDVNEEAKLSDEDEKRYQSYLGRNHPSMKPRSRKEWKDHDTWQKNWLRNTPGEKARRALGMKPDVKEETTKTDPYKETIKFREEIEEAKKIAGLNQEQRLRLAKMKDEISKKHREAKTDAERAAAEKEWENLIRQENFKEETIIEDSVQDHEMRVVIGTANGKGFQKTFENADHQKKWAATQKEIHIHSIRKIHEENELDEMSKHEIAKKAHAGKDLGKPGKNFKKVEAKAAKEYGSKKAGERVAAAAMWKNLRRENVEIDETLAKNAKASDYIDDFVHSKNKRFSGDSKKERIHRALGAYYAKKRGK